MINLTANFVRAYVLDGQGAREQLSFELVTRT